MKVHRVFDAEWDMHMLQCCNIHCVPKKTKQDLFLSELHQIYTNFDNFWQKDGKRSKYMQGALTFHLT